MISTTALAKEKNLQPNELFQILNDKKWIYRKDNKWNLTREGRMAGGDIQYNPKYGEYIVWPIDLDIDKQTDYNKALTASKIGEHFKLSSQKVNLFLAELGWIDKDKGGWICTQSGRKNGAIQMEAMNGKPYVVWQKEILENKHLVREIKIASGEEVYKEDEETNTDADDFRKKFPAQFRTPDGHYVRSRAEVMIDDFLYKHEIVHAYEKKLNIDENMYCDFYLPKSKLYIEYWGLEENEKYLERKNTKLELYSKYKFNLIELNDSDIVNLEELLAAKLRKYDIVVD